MTARWRCASCCDRRETALIDSTDIRLLAEVGFLAAARGDIRNAQAIFLALERLRPAASFPYVGMAAALMNAGKPDEAVQVLDRGLRAAGPQEQEELQAFRGLALHLAGRASESQRALQLAGDLPLARVMRGERTETIQT